ncbi:MAG: ATPase, T2SS/T4P/T4SS family [Candidatus Omnitrophota bacterium]
MNEDDLQNLLLESNLLTPEDLEKAIDEKQKLNRPLQQVVLDMGLLEKESLYKAIAQHIGIEFKGLSDLEIPEDLLKIYTEELARSTKSVPLFIEDDILHVAMEDPEDVSSIDQVQLFTNYPIEVYLSSPEDIKDSLSRLYKGVDSATLFSELQEGREEGKPLSETVSIIKIVDLVVAQAVRDRASDIHIEPEENMTRLRFRVDGVLHEIPSPPKEWEPAVISRIKVLAGMDIAESRTPQDGHFQARIDEKIIDFRVSSLPTIHGENIVLRLLDTASVTIGLERLGFTTYEDLKLYEELIARPYGIILSTGPTGCGKTTTLYSALMRINTPDRNIITLEDPVEYRLGLIRQVEINPKAGITFANGLRAILRQDPDVIMVGEIRDLETARMAVQAALTGHLVFSTLHTNDAPSSISRLVDMGIESFLLAASLIGIMAQRLVRCICPKCKEKYDLTPGVIKKYGLQSKKDTAGYRGTGCQECKGTGYKGRTGLFEMMSVDDKLSEMINAKESSVALRKAALEKGMRSLWEDGRNKAISGLTTFEEVARVCEEQAMETRAADEIDIKPYVKEEIQAIGTVLPKDLKVDSKALEDYRSKMTRWLSGK